MPELTDSDVGFAYALPGPVRVSAGFTASFCRCGDEVAACAEQCDEGIWNGDNIATTCRTDCTRPELPPACGDMMGGGVITATDALAVLDAAVLDAAVTGRRCDRSRCDVDSSGHVVTTDALTVLQFAVGKQVQLLCDRL